MKKPEDIIVVIITITICVIIITAMVKDIVRPGSTDVKVLGQLTLALVAIISLYIGTKLKGR